MRQERSFRDQQHRRQRFFAWWYACIAGAFVLLGLRSLVRSEVLWTILLRFGIAAGFLVLAGLQRSRRR